jgi:hypothetical protein
MEQQDRRGALTSCPVRVLSRAVMQCSCRVDTLGRPLASVRVERRSGPRVMRPVCFR